MEIFRLADPDLIRRLRNFLRTYGCWVPRDGALITENLVRVINSEEFHEWTTQEINDQLRNRGSFYSRQNQPLPPNALSQPPAQVQPQQSRTDNVPPTGNPLHEDPYSDQQSGRPSSTTKLITDLMKVYPEDKRYGGELYDFLDSKLQVFYDCCNKVGLPEDQFDKAFSIMLKSRASVYYYNHIVGRNLGFELMTDMIKKHFETEENRQLYMSMWRETTLPRIVESNPSKTKLECLQILFDELQKVQMGLSGEYQKEYNLRDQVISACRGVEECNLALYKPATTFEGVCAELRSAVGTATRSRETQQYNLDTTSKNQDSDDDPEQLWTDRTYGRRGRDRGGQGRGGQRGRGGSRGGYRERREYQGGSASYQKKCYICNKSGCWSTKHPMEERRQAFDRFRQRSQHKVDHDITPAYYQSFLAQCEGVEGLEDERQTELDQLLMNMEMEDGYDNYVTELGEIDSTQTVAILNDQSTRHAITREDIFHTPTLSQQLALGPDQHSVFTFEDRYSSEVFQGIMPDSGAAGVSTAGQLQFMALRKINASVQLDTATAGAHKIRFSKGTAVSQRTIRVDTPLGVIIFHVVPTNTPFLFCIQDMDKMGVKLDNLENVLIQGNKVVPVVRKWGHPWMLLHQHEQSMA
ncbi:hypothetical protein BDZ45DRAFT_627121 [Acephala macrosclerotiorum]|nr:hypothetical protein BDZ45DRAFT_627121 [Acephala macrosclerotiorum]